MFKAITTIAIITLTLSQCSDNGTKPPDENILCEITDTTSHNITWRVDTVGVFPSVLFDVAAIDEQNVWAVGVAYTPEYDSVWNTTNKRHNAIKWNGSEYVYYQIPVNSYDGGPTIQQLRVILPFSNQDFWFFSEAGSYVLWDGSQWSSAYIDARKGTPQAAWGTSSSDFYLVGDNGSISYYDGAKFTLMESTTEVDLFEIKGYVDEETGEKHIWVLGEEDGEAVVLAYQDGQWTNIWDMDLLGNYRFPQSIYITDSKSLVMTLWSGLDQKGRLYCFDQGTLLSNRLLGEHNTFAYGFSGSSKSDLFVAGSFNSIEHFNGSEFLTYPEIGGDGWFYEVDVSLNHVFMVGEVYQLPLFVHGKR